MKFSYSYILKQRSRLTASLVLLVLALTLGPRLPVAVATPTGTLYVTPSVIPVLPVKSFFNVTVKVANMDSFSGWDIQIVTEPVLNATRLYDYPTMSNILTANASGIPLPAAHCVNGVGTGCTATDGPGIVHSAFGDTKTTAGSGLLFTITYNVTGNRPYSPITIQDDSFSSSSTTGVPHTSIEGVYGTPDFTVAANPSSIVVFHGSSNTSNIVLDSISFAGAVNITAVVFPSLDLLKISLSPIQARLAPHGTASVVLTAHADSSLPASLYRVRVIATNGTISHSGEVGVRVPADADFQIGASPGELRTRARDSNSTTIVVKSENGFSGTVSLSLQTPAGASASLNTLSLAIPRDGEANATLSFTTQASFTRFKDLINVTGLSGSLSHTIDVVAEPPIADFKITADPISAIVQAGELKVLTIGVTSLDYYAGTIHLLGTAQSGVIFVFNSNSLYLNISQTVLMTLKVYTNSTTTPGDHVIALSGLDDFSARHGINVTLTVQARPQTPVQPQLILGLQPLVYFGVIGMLAVFLAVLGVREWRNTKRAQRRQFLAEN